jgi:hypothetical protein
VRNEFLLLLSTLLVLLCCSSPNNLNTAIQVHHLISLNIDFLPHQDKNKDMHGKDWGGGCLLMASEHLVSDWYDLTSSN